MTTLSKRREAGATCPRCRSPGYDMTPPVEGECDRPAFKCTSCGNHWTCGKSGGVYAEYAGVEL